MILQKPKRISLLLFVCIGVIPCIIFLVLFFGVFKGGTDFKRVQLVPRKVYSESILQRYKLEHFKLRGANYINAKSEGAAFNGDLHLKKMYTVKKFQGLFDRIITKGVHNLKRKGKKVIIDKKMQDALKALGYL
jgi:hypothetical protein